MNKVIVDIRQELKKRSDPTTKQSGERFFKEPVKLYGVKTALVSKIGAEYFKDIKHLPKQEIFNLCEELWHKGIMEETFIACQWSYRLRRDFTNKDFKLFERWIKKYVTNWAACDTFCNHTMGSFLEMYPIFAKKLRGWAKSKNRWQRRAAVVSLIVPTRKGEFLPDIFALAEILLEDPDDMVQKGYGWLLKVASEAHLQKVFSFVMKNKNKMPRTALRYAIEKMPKAKKVKAMAK